jgi:hypothetical protein
MAETQLSRIQQSISTPLLSLTRSTLVLESYRSSLLSSFVSCSLICSFALSPHRLPLSRSASPSSLLTPAVSLLRNRQRADLHHSLSFVNLRIPHPFARTFLTHPSSHPTAARSMSLALRARLSRVWLPQRRERNQHYVLLRGGVPCGTGYGHRTEARRRGKGDADDVTHECLCFFVTNAYA